MSLGGGKTQSRGHTSGTLRAHFGTAAIVFSGQGAPKLQLRGPRSFKKVNLDIQNRTKFPTCTKICPKTPQETFRRLPRGPRGSKTDPQSTPSPLKIVQKLISQRIAWSTSFLIGFCMLLRTCGLDFENAQHAFGLVIYESKSSFIKCFCLREARKADNLHVFRHPGAGTMALFLNVSVYSK